MLHSDLASGDPKNRPEDTLRWLSVAQYKVFGPRSKASRSPLLQTAYVRVFSRLQEHSSWHEIETPVSNKQLTREITVLFVLSFVVELSWKLSSLWARPSSDRVLLPLDLGLCLPQHIDFFTSPRALDIRSSCHFSPSRLLCRSPPAPHLESTLLTCPPY